MQNSCNTCLCINKNINDIITQLIVSLKDTKENVNAQQILNKDRLTVSDISKEQLIPEFFYLRRLIAETHAFVKGCLPSYFTELLPKVVIDWPAASRIHSVNCISTVRNSHNNFVPYCANSIIEHKYGASIENIDQLQKYSTELTTDLRCLLAEYYVFFTNEWRRMENQWRKQEQPENLTFIIDPELHFIMHETFSVGLKSIWNTFCDEDFQYCSIGFGIKSAYIQQYETSLMRTNQFRYTSDLLIRLYIAGINIDDFHSAAQSSNISGIDADDFHSAVRSVQSCFDNDDDDNGYCAVDGDRGEDYVDDAYKTNILSKTGFQEEEHNLDDMLAEIKFQYPLVLITANTTIGIQQQQSQLMRVTNVLSALKTKLIRNFKHIFSNTNDLYSCILEFGIKIYNKLKFESVRNNPSRNILVRGTNNWLRKLVNGFIFDFSQDLLTYQYNGHLSITDNTGIAKLYSAVINNDARRNKLCSKRLPDEDLQDLYSSFNGNFKRKAVAIEIPKEPFISPDPPSSSLSRLLESESRKVCDDDDHEPSSENAWRGEWRGEEPLYSPDPDQEEHNSSSSSTSRLLESESRDVYDDMSCEWRGEDGKYTSETSIGKVILRYGFSMDILQETFYESLCRADDKTLIYLKDCLHVCNVEYVNVKVFNLYRWNNLYPTDQLSKHDISNIVCDVKELIHVSFVYSSAPKYGKLLNVEERERIIIEQDFRHKTALDYVRNSRTIIASCNGRVLELE